MTSKFHLKKEKECLKELMKSLTVGLNQDQCLLQLLVGQIFLTENLKNDSLVTLSLRVLIKQEDGSTH